MPHRDPGLGGHRALLAILVVASLAFNLMPTMIAPAMPAIQDDLHATPTGVAWVLTGYLLAAAVGTPIVARLGDVHGRERTLLVTLAVFACGLIVAALGRTLPVLIVGRVIQGMVGGAILPLAFGLLRDRLPPERVASGVSVLTATMGVGGSAGLVIAGLVVDAFSYRALFWLGLAMTAVAGLLVSRLRPVRPRHSGQRVDWAGAALLGVALTALLLAIGRANAWGWTAPPTLAFAGAGLGLLGVWALLERAVAAPLVDMRLLRVRGVWIGNLVSLLSGCCMFGAFLLVPQFVQVPRVFGGYGFGASVTVAGVAMVPCSLALLVGGASAARVNRAVGARAALLGGFALAGGGYLLLIARHGELWEVVAAAATIGLGLGLVIATMAALVLRSVSLASTGEATSTTVIMRTVGGAVGAQVAAAVLAAHPVLGSGMPTEQGYLAAFALCAGVALAGLLVALALPRATRRRLSAVQIVNNQRNG